MSIAPRRQGLFVWFSIGNVAKWCNLGLMPLSFEA
jgi:hypothetical protein